MRRTIAQRHLIQREDHILVACSGGKDSVALLLTLYVLKHDFQLHLHTAHVNHMLRGEEADEDAQWVVSLCNTLGIPVHAACADVQTMLEQRGGTLEERARWARMELLKRIRDEEGCDVIATAHHKDDQAETVMMHLLRGSGTKGLGGMSWGPQGGIIRPFLATERDEIVAAMKRWGINWREDSSNSSLDIARNRIRHRILPALAESWNPRLTSALVRTAEISREDEQALETWTERAWAETTDVVTSERVHLDSSLAATYPLGIRRRLLRRVALCLRTVQEPLSFAETERLTDLIDRRIRVDLRGKMSAWHGTAGIWLMAADVWRGPTSLDMNGTTRIPGWGTLSIGQIYDDTEHHVSIAVDKLKEPLALRRWNPGDRIMVNDEGKEKLIADLARRMNPSVDPQATVLVVDAEKIVWAPGISSIPTGADSRHTINIGWTEERSDDVS